MYCIVVPAVRSIRGKDEFVYALPNTSAVTIGQIVNIPWRNQVVLGVVWKPAVPRPKFITKSVQSITEYTLSEDYVRWIEWFSKYYYVSKSHVVKMAIPDFPKRQMAHSSLLQEAGTQSDIRVSRQRVKAITTTVTLLQDSSQKRQAVLYNHTQEIMAVTKGLLQKRGYRLAIIVPAEHDLALWTGALAKYRPIVVRSRMSMGSLYLAWQQCMNEQGTVFIGTKRLSLFPLGMFDAVIVLNPESESHKQWDLNPRYVVSRVVDAQIESAATQSIHYTESLPVADYQTYRVDSTLVTTANPPLTTIVDLTSEPFQDGQRALAASVWSSISDARTSFIWFNKKGTGYFLICAACDELIADAIIERCPKCGSIDLKKRGLGTTSLQTLVQAAFSQRPVIEITKDTGVPQIDYATCPIIIGTSFALTKIDWTKIDCTVVLSVDHILSQPDFRATERVLHELVHLRNLSENLIIQTYTPTHPLWQAVGQFLPTQWYDDELKQRQQFDLPPFGFRAWVRNTKTREEKYCNAPSDIPDGSDWIIDRE